MIPRRHQSTRKIIERQEAGPRVDEQLVDKLWLTLSGNMRDRTLADNRALADDWVARSLPADRVNFWGHDWHGMVAPFSTRAASNRWF